MATISRMRESSPDTETTSSYRERLDLFFKANSMVAGKQVSVLLNVIGSKQYDLIRGLMTPAALKDLTLKELYDLLKSHFEPKPLVIPEHLHF